MDRRTWLKTGAVGGIGSAGTLGLDGCAHTPPAAPDALAAIDAADVDRYLAGIDRRLAWIDKADGGALIPRSTRPLTVEGKTELQTVSRLFRKSARALYLTGNFLEAPTELQAHPGMQARVLAAQSDMDEAVFGTTAMLESLTEEDHRKIRGTLRERPELAENLAQFLDAPAHEDGMPAKRRFLLRAGILDLAGRMKAQSPALVIDPYVKKVRKIEARGARAAAADTARLMAARIGEEAFWAHQERMAQLAAAWEVKLGRAGGAGSTSAAVVASLLGAPGAALGGPGTPAPTTEPPAPAASSSTSTPMAVSPPAAGPPVTKVVAPSKVQPVSPTPGHPAKPPALATQTPGDATVSVGAQMMGYGGASVGVGLIFAGLYKLTAAEAFLWPALIMGVTVGPILLVIGLLVIIVGALMRLSEP